MCWSNINMTDMLSALLPLWLRFSWVQGQTLQQKLTISRRKQRTLHTSTSAEQIPTSHYFLQKAVTVEGFKKLRLL